MSQPSNIRERYWSTLLKVVDLSRDDLKEHPGRKRLYDELRRQLARQRDQAGSMEEARELNRILNRLERDEQETRLMSYPMRSHVELTTFCNLRCRMCGQSYFEDYSGPRRHMDQAILEEVQKVLPYVEELVATGFGESLLSPHFWEFMEMLPRRGGIKRLITNGVLLTGETSRRMMDYPINEYFISFEAVDAQTYQFVRSIDRFDQVVQNIRDLDKNRRESGREDVSITLSFVAMKRNIEQLPDFVRKAKEYGADRVLVAFLHVTRPGLIEESLFFEPQLANRMFAEAEKVSREVGIEYEYPRGFAPRESDPERSRRVKNCCEPWEFIYFESNGAVRPCCIYPKGIGKLIETPLEEVWNNRAYMAIRKTVNSERPEPYCARCWFTRHVDHNDRRYHINLVDKRGVNLEEAEASKGVWDEEVV
jgi:radical SAM protein with 4Fe4S-binding SPASM domain